MSSRSWELALCPRSVRVFRAASAAALLLLPLLCAASDLSKVGLGRGLGFFLRLFCLFLFSFGVLEFDFLRILATNRKACVSRVPELTVLAFSTGVKKLRKFLKGAGVFLQGF